MEIEKLRKVYEMVKGGENEGERVEEKERERKIEEREGM